MTKRERWLVTQAFAAGWCDGSGRFIPDNLFTEKVSSWLNDCVADAVTVEMVLDECAPDAEDGRLR